MADLDTRPPKLPPAWCRVRASRAEGDERDRLWRRWAAVDPGLDGYAGLRSNDTTVVVFHALDEAA